MTYTTQLQAISRTPIVVVKLHLDFCSRVFGQAPCQATGTRCYNTFFTCRDRFNFTKGIKEYVFSSADAPIPFAGPRPYVLEVQYIPTEIKDNFTISGRVNISFVDEPDTDVGIDPYLPLRTSTQGTFWKKLIERNKNYKGRMAEVYEGFLGLPFEEFEKKFVGKIENIEINGAEVKIEVADLLRTLADVEVPEKIDCKLVGDITTAVPTITLTDVSKLPATGYVIIGEEIIGYESKDTTTQQILNCTRGAFETTAVAHKDKAKVGTVRYYAPTNPFDILLEMLTVDAKLDSNFINTPEFHYWRDYPERDINFSGIITEPTKLSELYFEIVDLLDAKSWIAEDWRITVRKNLPNHPEREYGTIRDDVNIIDESASVDLNEKSRYTRVFAYWDKKVLGDLEETKEYNRLDVAIEADAESVNGYGETIEKRFFCQWIFPQLAMEEDLERYIRNFLARRIFRTREAMPIISCAVEIKDSLLHTGDWIRITTDELANKYGFPLTNIAFQIVRRERRPEKIELELLRLHPRRLCFITPAGFPLYDLATLTQREFGFISNAGGMMNEEDEGYFIY